MICSCVGGDAVISCPDFLCLGVCAACNEICVIYFQGGISFIALILYFRGCCTVVVYIWILLFSQVVYSDIQCTAKKRSQNIPFLSSQRYFGYGV